MRRLGVTLLASAVVLAVAVTATAQDRSRSNPGTTTGSAVSRSSPSPSPSSPSGGSTSSSSGGGSSMGSARSGGGPDGPSSRAIPRGGSDPGRSRVNSRSGDDQSGARAIPAYSRPRDGRSPSGTAIERANAPYTSLPIYVRYGYYPFGFGYPGYGTFGLGFNYYDPFWWGYPGYGYGGYYGGYYTGGGYYGGRGAYRDTGGLRLKVKQRDAQVFVDGYYVGLVNDFDGVFQRLTLEGGGHRVELRSEGFQPLSFEVLIVPGETITYRGDLKRVP